MRASPGIVWSWGDNFHGHLGNGTPVDSDAPTRVSGVMSATAITSGPIHSLAIQSDGTAIAWGDNFYGQLGIGSTVSPISRPVTVAGRFGQPRLDRVVGIAAGLKHSLTLLDDGTVWSFGDNDEGQLGTANIIASQVPTQSLNFTVGENVAMSNVRAIAAGEKHSLALTAGGIPYAWGENASGQLGQGNVLGDFTVGVQVALFGTTTTPLSNVVAIAAGAVHSLFLMADGTIRATGRSDYGQVGIGSTGMITLPTLVRGIGGSGILSTVIAIVAGREHSLALLSDGRVVAWGSHNSGELGIGAAPELCGGIVPCSTVPRLVVGEFGSGTLSGVRAIAAGTYHSLALKGENVLSWGSHIQDELGNATPPSELCGAALTNPCRRTPRRAVNLDGIGSIAAGGQASFAIQTYGAVRTWGTNFNGQLGIGHANPVTGLVATTGLAGVRGIESGGTSNFASTEFGYLSGWGHNAGGRLGIGTLTTNVTTPTLVTRSEDGAPLADVQAVAAGVEHALALLHNGTVRAWGVAAGGKLGEGSASLESCDLGDCSTRARPVVGPTGGGVLSNVTGIASGSGHSLAVLSDGTVRAWGSNVIGQLGVPGIGETTVPTTVRGIGGIGVLTGIVAVAANSSFNFALGSDGRIRSWGFNGSGQLGHDNQTNSPTPQLVVDGSGGIFDNVIAIAPGTAHVLALRADGTVWAWGSNTSGQLGNDSLPAGCSSSCADYPVQVLGSTGVCCLRGAIAIAAGSAHSLALLDTGQVVAWGNNQSGALGFPPTGETCSGSPCSRRPALVPLEGPATAIAAGGLSSLAIVARQADISVALTFSPSIPVSGRLVTANLVVTNLGPDTAAGPTASGVTPTGFGLGTGGPYLTLAISSGLTRTIPGSLIPLCASSDSFLNRTIFECLSGGIDAGRSFTMTLEFTVTAASGALVQAFGQATEFDDPSSANNGILAKATVNTPPTGLAGQVTTGEGVPIVITLSATDPDSGQVLSVLIVQGPANGTLGALAGTQVTYTPGPGFSGTDSFTFRANDGLEDGPTATVQITVSRAGLILYLPVVAVNLTP